MTLHSSSITRGWDTSSRPPGILSGAGRGSAGSAASSIPNGSPAKPRLKGRNEGRSVMPRRVRARIRIAALSVLVAQGMASPGWADDEFFKGKTINFVIATAPGGGYDTYSRLIA